MPGNDPDWYTVLGVGPTVDEEAIRQAYRKLAREHHPDVVGAAGAEAMKRINAAYRVLSDPKRRHAYDQQRGGVATPPSRSSKQRHSRTPPGRYGSFAPWKRTTAPWLPSRWATTMPPSRWGSAMGASKCGKARWPSV
jgi:curved DNA-binding protein CbpA